MGRPLGEEIALIWGFTANFGMFFAVAAPISKRISSGVISAMLALALCFILAFCWMLLCEHLYQERSARKEEYDFRFLFFCHFAPTAVICASLCFLFLRRALVH